VFDAQPYSRGLDVDLCPEIEPFPVVADGTAYLGTQNGVFAAIDAQTGGQKWILKIGFTDCLTPVVSGSMIYAGY
jgi:outer membrane protein assembly factor BamB